MTRAGAKVGDRVRLKVKRESTEEMMEGLLMPRFETEHGDYVVLKLKTGYNVGVRIDTSTLVEVLGRGEEPHFTRPPVPKTAAGLPRVSIISTGGTIASKVDYRTGAVKPALDAEDLYHVVPELAQVAEIEANILLSVFSENIGPQYWTKIAESAAERIRSGKDGIVIAHGTDTMAYTAAALSFAMNEAPAPIVLVGSQRSSDRPSSDAATNLLASATVAGHAPFAEVVVAMHDWISDERVAIHRGTRVRKCHTSRRDAFRSINTSPIAYYDTIHRSLRTVSDKYRERHTRTEWEVHSRFDPNVILIKFHPGLSAAIIDWAMANEYKGIVLEGTGLGHVGEAFHPALQRANNGGIVIAMCSQCIWGRVHMDVYSAGRDLQKIGVIPLGDMLAETALTKMMWAFGQENDPEKVKKIMTTDIANEFSDRRLLEAQQ